jgi:hypothetical protein
MPAPLLFLHQVGANGIQVVIEFSGMLIPELPDFFNNWIIH